MDPFFGIPRQACFRVRFLSCLSLVFACPASFSAGLLTWMKVFRTCMFCSSRAGTIRLSRLSLDILMSNNKAFGSSFLKFVC